MISAAIALHTILVSRLDLLQAERAIGLVDEVPFTGPLTLIFAELRSGRESVPESD